MLRKLIPSETHDQNCLNCCVLAGLYGLLSLSALVYLLKHLAYYGSPMKSDTQKGCGCGLVGLGPLVAMALYARARRKGHGHGR